MMQVGESVPLWGPAFMIKAKEDERLQKAKHYKNSNIFKSKKSIYMDQVFRNAWLEELVESGSVSEIVSFLKAKPVGSFSDDFLNACLLQATRIGDRSVIEGLICHGANVNYRGDKMNFGENTPLTMCIQKGNVEIARLLLNNEARPDYRKPSSRETALMMAVKSSCAESFVALLLEWREELKLDRRNRRGKTALYLAVMFKKKRVARMLLENGADVDLKLKTRKSARDLATKLGLCDALGISPQMHGPLTTENVTSAATPIMNDITNVSDLSLTKTESGDVRCDEEAEEVNKTE